MTVLSFVDTFAEAAETGSDLAAVDRRFALGWLRHLQTGIAERAAADGTAVRDHACTMLGAVIGPSSSVFLQVGDGAIVVGEGGAGKLDWVFWPQHGEFANQTNFIVGERLDEVLDFASRSGRLNEVALFSDGIERLVLDLAARTIHAPSLRPIFDWLANEVPGSPTEPSSALTAYLRSDHVNRRTDDDKTLVMATRARPSAAVD